MRFRSGGRVPRRSLRPAGGKLYQHLAEGGVSSKVGERTTYWWIIAVTRKVKIEDIFPGALARWTRFQLEQVDLVGGQHAQAGMKRAGLMSGSHHKHGLRLALAAWSRFPTKSNEARVVIFNGLDVVRQYFQL